MKALGMISLGLLFVVTAAADPIRIVTLSAESVVKASAKEMTVEIQNEMGVPIYTQAASATPGMFVVRIEKKEGDTWRSFDAHCSWPDCDIDFDGPGKMESGRRVSVKVSLVRYDKELKKVVSLEPGTYRWIGTYQIRPDGTESKEWKFEDIQSNKFVVNP